MRMKICSNIAVFARGGVGVVSESFPWRFYFLIGVMIALVAEVLTAFCFDGGILSR